MNDELPTSGEILAALLGRVYVINRIASSRTAGGHSPSFYRTLGLLADRNGRRIGDLTAAVHVSQPGMTKIVRTLEDQGLVTRSPDPEDSRATLVHITDAGRAAIRQRERLVVEQLMPEFGPLSDEERRTLQDAVTILSKHTPGEPTAPGKDAR